MFILVAAFRCTFPNRYNNNIVLHDTWFSCTWLTRFMATFSETFWLYQLSLLARDLNAIRSNGPLVWIDIAAWIMVVLCCVAQCCVWSSFIFETDILMWYEEFNWAIMFVLNTMINLAFFFTGDVFGGDPRWNCVWVSLVFGAIFLPFQIGGHLPYIVSEERKLKYKPLDLTWRQVKKGCSKSLFYWKVSTSAHEWGDSVGAVWMFGYWVLEPVWLYYVAKMYSEHLKN